MSRDGSRDGPAADGEVHVGELVEYQGSRGTVRYIGRLSGKGERTWVGVEWSDGDRGRHSGTHDGHAYFTCGPKAGSFVRADKLADGGRRSLLAVVEQRYLRDATDESFRQALVVVGGGVVNIANDAAALAAPLRELSIVDVSGMGVASVEIGLEHVLPAVTELRMSRNLFRGVSCVLHVLRQLLHLQILNVSGNMLEDGEREGENEREEEGGEWAAETLRELNMNQCTVSWGTVGRVLQHTQRVETLRLYNCGLAEIGSAASMLPATLRMIDLDGNNLSWADISKTLGQLPALNELYISGNKLQDTDLGAVDGRFQKLETLSLARNALEGWRMISWLHNLGQLRHLRVRGNPITPEEEEEQGDGASHTASSLTPALTWRMRTIARIAGLSTLDGSAISQDERILSERRYLREEALRGGIHPRAHELAQLYADVAANSNAMGAGQRPMRDDLIRVTLIARDSDGEAGADGDVKAAGRRSVVRDMPRGARLGRVRAVGRRLLRVDDGCALGVQTKAGVDWQVNLARDLRYWSADAAEVQVIFA